MVAGHLHLAEELRRRKVRPEDLVERPKGDRQKARIALRLREETTMTWDWIAEKLAMGVGAHAAHCVRVSGYAGLTPSLVSGSGVACCIDGYVLATRTALR